MYIRDNKVRTARKAKQHDTGRRCARPSCQGTLRDCVVNNGELLPEIAMRRAITHAFRADLLVCIGESMRVTPAAEIPEIVIKKKNSSLGARLVIINMAHTPVHDECDMSIVASPDSVLEFLCETLGRPLPRYRLERHLLVGNHFNTAHLKCEWTLFVRGIDHEGNPQSTVRKVELKLPRGYHPRAALLPQEPHILTKKAVGGHGGEVQMKIWFTGSHGEPPIELEHCLRLQGKGAFTHYLLTLADSGDYWEVSYPDDPEQAGDDSSPDMNRRPNSANY